MDGFDAFFVVGVINEPSSGEGSDVAENSETRASS